MKHSKTILLFSLMCGLLALGVLQAQITNGLHYTRVGKGYWYNADTSQTGAPAPGFESLTGVPIDDPNVACEECHGPTDAAGNEWNESNPYTGPGCYDCHPNSNPTEPLSVDQCLSCHGRQKAIRAKFTDVHQDSTCWFCHAPDLDENGEADFNDMHGDGTLYASHLEVGAIRASCDSCHTTAKGTLPDHSSYDPHGGKLHCDACHTQSVITCYNCHFESQVLAKKKRAKQQITNFVMLVNRANDGKVGTATFQSLEYQNETWIAYAPFHAHATTEIGRTCTDCHQNLGGQIEAIQQYNSNGEIQFVTWNAQDSTLSALTGVVPIPADYVRSFRMDFITYNGDPSDPIGPSKNWSPIGKTRPDGHQMFFATPLSKTQMAKIGYDTLLTGIEDGKLSEIPTKFTLLQNYPNPFNPMTTIGFQLPFSSQVSLRVFNVLGSEVQTLIAGENYSAGGHTLTFNAGELSSGIYFYRLETPNFVQTKKMFLLQ